MIKLLIGGSPCTHWSIAQSKNRETTASGVGWELFKNYLYAKTRFKPDLFLYENNKSAAQAIKDQISEELGVELMYINSALVSAQNRQRFYAFNWHVEQPLDRGILLKDILESGGCRIPYSVTPDKARTVMASYEKRGTAPAQIKNNAFPDRPNKQKCDYIIEPMQESCAMFAHPHGWNEGLITYGKSQTITTGSSTRQQNVLIEPAAAAAEIIKDKKEMTFINKIYEIKNGFITILNKQYQIELPDGLYIIRKLTPIECERLQTLPDNYTAGVSNTQRYKGIGNGWTAEVIIHILSGALANVDRNEKIIVLSMYDGIGTGRYCLDKMGFNNVEYYAFEIDDYAMQVANNNYPDIMQCGDAFQMRDNTFNINGLLEGV